MSAHMTKAQLIDENAKLRIHCDYLEREIARLVAAPGKADVVRPSTNIGATQARGQDGALHQMYRDYLAQQRAIAAAGQRCIKVKSFNEWSALQ
jgi:hypothetical protein